MSMSTTKVSHELYRTFTGYYCGMPLAQKELIRDYGLTKQAWAGQVWKSQPVFKSSEDVCIEWISMVMSYSNYIRDYVMFIEQPLHKYLDIVITVLRWTRWSRSVKADIEVWFKGRKEEVMWKIQVRPDILADLYLQCDRYTPKRIHELYALANVREITAASSTHFSIGTTQIVHENPIA